MCVREIRLKGEAFRIKSNSLVEDEQSHLCVQTHFQIFAVWLEVERVGFRLKREAFRSKRLRGARGVR